MAFKKFYALTSKWPTWTQILFVFVTVTTLVSFASLYTLRIDELEFLEKDIRADQEKMISVLKDASVDLIITQDIPSLKTLLDGVVKNQKLIHHISISDTQNRTLYGTEHHNDVIPSEYVRLNRHEIRVSGEIFGFFTIMWDLRSRYADIDRHLDDVRRHNSVAMVFLALLLALPLYILVARPLAAINRRINDISNEKLYLAPPLSSSREIRRISDSLNTLTRTLLSHQEQERNYRHRLESEVSKRTVELNTLYEEMKHHATHDRLTGLPNRGMFADHVKNGLARAKRSGSPLAILYIDMDGFKDINDRYGHQAGDEVLVTVATRLRKALRAEDTVARLGGDEFCVLLPQIGTATDSATVAGKILRDVGGPVQVAGQEYQPKLSIGIALFPDDADSMEALMKMSDSAMYHAKEHGGSAFHFYNALFQNESSRHLALKNEIQRAIVENELVLYFQPIVDLRSGFIASFEALVRWQHPHRGIISPADFIPLAEKNGQIVNIDQWVIESLIGQIRNFSDIAERPIKVSANLSSRSFRDNGLLSRAEQIQAVSALLDIEITESTMLVRDSRSQRSFDTLRSMGVRLTLDDFGTGYSSLSYLTNLPISGIKIDRSFITQIDTNERNATIVASILGLCRQLNLSVVAEGVERREELEWLRAKGCTAAQGYFFSKPIPYQEALGLLKRDFSVLFDA